MEVALARFVVNFVAVAGALKNEEIEHERARKTRRQVRWTSQRLHVFEPLGWALRPTGSSMDARCLAQERAVAALGRSGYGVGGCALNWAVHVAS